MNCIGLQLGPLIEHINQSLDLVCRLGINTWQGREEVQLFIEDIRPAVGVQIGTDASLGEGIHTEEWASANYS